MYLLESKPHFFSLLLIFHPILKVPFSKLENQNWALWMFFPLPFSNVEIICGFAKWIQGLVEVESFERYSCRPCRS